MLGFQTVVCSHCVETITTFLSLTESVNWTVASWDQKNYTSENLGNFLVRLSGPGTSGLGDLGMLLYQLFRYSLFCAVNMYGIIINFEAILILEAFFILLSFMFFLLYDAVPI